MNDAWLTIVVAAGTVALMAAIVGAAFFFAARAERRRRENAAPDLLDVVDGLLEAGAELAPLEVRRRYRNRSDD